MFPIILKFYKVKTSCIGALSKLYVFEILNFISHKLRSNFPLVFLFFQGE